MAQPSRSASWTRKWWLARLAACIRSDHRTCGSPSAPSLITMILGTVTRSGRRAAARRRRRRRRSTTMPVGSTARHRLRESPRPDRMRHPSVRHAAPSPGSRRRAHDRETARPARRMPGDPRAWARVVRVPKAGAARRRRTRTALGSPRRVARDDHTTSIDTSAPRKDPSRFAWWTVQAVRGLSGGVYALGASRHRAGAGAASSRSVNTTTEGGLSRCMRENRFLH
jgi:hypothetical protein